MSEPVCQRTSSAVIRVIKAEHLVHRHGSTSGKADQADQERASRNSPPPRPIRPPTPPITSAHPSAIVIAAPARQGRCAYRHRRTGHAGSGGEDCCESLEHAFRDASRPLAYPERRSRVAERINLDYLRANGDIDAISVRPLMMPLIGARRAVPEPSRRQRLPHPIPDLHGRIEAASTWGVDKPGACDTTYGLRFAAEGQCRADRDDCTEVVAPTGFDGEIDVAVCNEVRPETDRERCNAALLFGDFPLAHPGIDHYRPIRRPKHVREGPIATGRVAPVTRA